MLELLLLMGLLLFVSPLMGRSLTSLYEGGQTFLHPVLGWLENLTYRIAGVDPKVEMSWKEYLKSLAVFNLTGFVFLFLLLIFQSYHLLNPQKMPNVPPILAFNIAASFVTNTNWQSYAGETTLSYGSQIFGLTVQNFLSAATGMSVLLALIRGIKRKNSPTIGNFFADLVRTVVYLLLPLSLILSIFLVNEGVVQTIFPYVEATTLEGTKQTIPLGPVASQVAIKQLGTNGGGFFNASSAHPFENPTSFSNFIEIFAILLIPVVQVYVYGMTVGDRKHARLLLSVMFLFWVAGLGIANYSEKIPNEVLGGFPLLEGKETRFGIKSSLLWSISTTATSNGSVNAMLDSLSPLAGGVALFNIVLGEQIFGGMGVGLSAMLMYVLLTVFLAGLMVGRTPEYLGKKIEAKEIQWVMVALLVASANTLIGSGIASSMKLALSSLENHGPHGLSEIVYAFASASGNNGSAFAGLNANTDFYNISLGIIMLISRCAFLVSALAIAGLLAAKKITPPSRGTFSTQSPLFACLLIGVILIVGASTFFPVLSLGPIAEHFMMLKGRSF